MSDKPVIVACLKWGDKYPAEYVNRLYRMVKRHLTIPYQFICFTENEQGLEEGIETRPVELDPDLKGWWYKLQLFQQKLHDLEGQILFLDLDVVIVDSIDELFDYKNEEFCIIKDLQQGKVYNSSVFKFEIGSQTHVWDGFQQDKHSIINRMHGDQDWISETVENAALWPKEWVVSFKKQCDARDKRSWGHLGKFLRGLGLLKPQGEAVIPEGARIVYFHGKPDPDDVAESSYDMWRQASWIKQAWRADQ